VKHRKRQQVCPEKRAAQGAEELSYDVARKRSYAREETDSSRELHEARDEEMVEKAR